MKARSLRRKCSHSKLMDPVNRWRQRRDSVRDLKQREAEMKEEYKKLMELDAKARRYGLPQYEELNPGAAEMAQNKFGAQASTQHAEVGNQSVE